MGRDDVGEAHVLNIVDSGGGLGLWKVDEPISEHMPTIGGEYGRF